MEDPSGSALSCLLAEDSSPRGAAAAGHEVLPAGAPHTHYVLLPAPAPHTHGWSIGEVNEAFDAHDEEVLFDASEGYGDYTEEPQGGYGGPTRSGLVTPGGEPCLDAAKEDHTAILIDDDLSEDDQGDEELLQA